MDTCVNRRKVHQVDAGTYTEIHGITRLRIVKHRCSIYHIGLWDGVPMLRYLEMARKAISSKHRRMQPFHGAPAEC